MALTMGCGLSALLAHDVTRAIQPRDPESARRNTNELGVSRPPHAPNCPVNHFVGVLVRTGATHDFTCKPSVAPLRKEPAAIILGKNGRSRGRDEVGRLKDLI